MKVFPLEVDMFVPPWLVRFSATSEESNLWAIVMMLFWDVFCRDVRKTVRKFRGMFVAWIIIFYF